jgi:N utilization substance protein B
VAESTAKPSLRRVRHQARRLALQAMYQWQIGGQELAEIETQFLEQEEAAVADAGYFRELLHRIPEQRAELDAALAGHLSRAPQTLDPVERAILWIATYELLKRHDVPYRVILNEAVDLSKLFGAEQSHKFVNGVLDKVARDCRSAEIAAGGAHR